MPTVYRLAAAAASAIARALRLALARLRWQSAGMAEHDTPTPAGLLLALSILVGALVGAIYGQPSLGLVAGVAVGAIIALALWLRDRARR